MDVSDLLSNKNVNKTKQLFSREGKIQEVKYSNPTVMFRGASILITCNSFFIDKLNQYDKLAIL